MVRNQGDDPILRLKSAVLILVMVLTILLVRSPSPTHAQFVISGWDYPDEYGQGIETIYYQIRFENETVKEWAYIYPSNTTQVFEVPINGTVYLRCTAWVNGTFVGASSLNEARLYARYDINVLNVLTNVLTQQNLTADGGSSADAPMYKIYDLVYLSGWHTSATTLMTNGFVAGQIYTGLITYEIFY